MQNNLEEILFEDVIDKNGIVFSNFRRTLIPLYGKVIFDISKGYFFLISICLLTIYFKDKISWWLLIIPAGLLIGYVAAYLALFIHEAGHFNIHPNKKTNDSLATIFLCTLFGLSLKSYRKIHWQHHLHLGTPNDTEVSYFNALSKLFLLETITGIHLLRTINKKENNTLFTREQIKKSRFMLYAGLLFHSIILISFILYGNWVLAIAWVLGFVIFFPFFATIRQVLEHRDELAYSTTDFTKVSHGKISRLFFHDLISSSFGPAGFTRHMIHHWDPQISYTRLKDVELFLLNCEKTSDLITQSKTKYTSVLKKLLSAG